MQDNNSKCLSHTIRIIRHPSGFNVRQKLVFIHANSSVKKRCLLLTENKISAFLCFNEKCIKIQLKCKSGCRIHTDDVMFIQK